MANWQTTPTLKEWAEDIADAIREKKSTTNKIPRLNFAQEIRSIETGGEILEPTAVPISGMVEKVYFNFNVDVSKMVEVIKNLSFIDSGLGVPVYPIISNIAGTDGLLFVKINDNFYYLQRGETHLIASISISGTEPEYEIKIIDNRDDSNFYKNDFTQPMEFGFENALELATSSIPDYVNSNELLKEMISITPIQKIEGGGGGSGIIEVEDLPTENIDENAIYKTNAPMDLQVWWKYDEDTFYTLKETIKEGTQVDPNITYYLVDSLPDNPNVSDLSTFSNIYCYIYNDIPYVYGNAGSGNTWFDVVTLFALMGTTVTNKGYAEHIGLTYEAGLYVTYSKNAIGINVENKNSIYQFDGNDWENYYNFCVAIISGTCKSIKIPSGISYLKPYLFYHNEHLENVELCDTLKIISSNAFAGCWALKQIEIPNSVIKIGIYAFSDCNSLENVTIGNGVELIDESAFNVCPIKEIYIPDNVKTLKRHAFYSCESLITARLSSQVATIEEYTFAYCESLKNIIIPKSITLISRYAFVDCSSLTDVYYTGTEEEWNAIIIGDGNEALKSATIHYNYVEE